MQIFQHGPFITVADEHDRTEFLRDAAAALRVGDPKAAKAFLTRLCRRRAWIEMYAEARGRRITQDDAQHLHSGRTRELLQMCEQMGFFATQVTHVTARHNFNF